MLTHKIYNYEVWSKAVMAQQIPTNGLGKVFSISACKNMKLQVSVMVQHSLRFSFEFHCSGLQFVVGWDLEGRGFRMGDLYIQTVLL
jgi:hypothetical protein